MSPSETLKYIVTELGMTNPDPEVEARYATYAKRVLRMNDQIVEGAFHMETAWYLRAAPEGIQDRPHVHDTDEIIGFFGSDPANPYDLGGEIEIWLADDKHVIDRSTLLFIPAGMKHCPLNITRVDRPIFHFIAVTSRQYDKES
jgi:hypothetical protein